VKRRALLRLGSSAGLCAATRGTGRAFAAVCGTGRASAVALGVGRVLAAASPKTVIIGAGWAGIATAHALTRGGAAAADVTVIDREPVFRALPLSNAWLVGRTPLRLPAIDLADLARRQGWRFVAGEVTAIDRAQRSVQTRTGHARDRHLPYDTLVLATGAAADHSAWFGDDARAIAHTRERFAAGFETRELQACRQRLEAFAASGGGTLVMTVPPPPYRCPPAPYERAALIGWWIKARGLKAKLVLLDAGGGMQRFNRLFAQRYAAQIEHRLHAPVQRVDPFAQVVTTDDGDQHFDHALLLPPMHAGALVRDAGLAGRDARGQATRWAAVHADTLRSPHDERVVVIGDAMDSVSPLFGAYPKTAHIAADLGAAAAALLAAEPPRGNSQQLAALPRSQCHVWLDAEPPEQLQLDASFRRRGDGLIEQSVRQIDNPQPRDEDLVWARGVLVGRLGVVLG